MPDMPQEGSSPSISRPFPLTSADIREIRAFVGQHLGLAPDLPDPRAVADLAADAAAIAERRDPSTRLTLRVFADHVEISLGAEKPARESVKFATWLADSLRREGLSQEAAARRIGVSLKTVNRWIRGHNEPRLKELRRVGDVFGEPPLG
jgi:DNA-binding XRE family transcriptional regulator